nr:immunoglobulin heavy chain junction region [Mus musculus]
TVQDGYYVSLTT